MNKKPILLGILAGAVVVSGVWFSMFRHDPASDDKPSSNSTLVIDEEPKDKTDDGNEDATTDEEKEPDEIVIAPSDNPDEGIVVTPETDKPYVAEGELATVLTNYFKALPEYGGYAQDAEMWNIEDMGEEYGEKDERFNNLYSFMSYGYFTVEKSIPSFADPNVTIDYVPGGEIIISGFATVENGMVTVHYLDAAGQLLINDGYVNDELYMVMHNMTW